jgi:neutral ceramidase
MLRVGFGKADITPELGLPMVGMPGSPVGTGVRWPLTSRVFLADDGESRVAIVALDLIALAAEDVARLRERLAEAGGLPPNRIMVACSHTHRAPYTAPLGIVGDEAVPGADVETVGAFLDMVFSRTARAMTEAAAMLQPATLDIGRATVPGWAFNRRPIYAGGEVGTHGWAWLDDFERMEGVPDEEVWALAARRDDGSLIGGLTGFACHPTAMAHDPVYSADYPGVLVEALEARHGGTFAFLLGAAGDTSTPDPTSRDPESGFGEAHTMAMGTALADALDAALGSAETIAGEPLAVTSATIEIAQRRPTPEQVELARWYLNEAPPGLDELDFTRRLYGHDYTFRDGVQVGNERHAQELLKMWAWQRGPDARLVEALEIQVVAIGEAAIVALPVELFAALGERIKTGSPFRHTFLATLANGWHGYVPTLEAFSRGGYEPRFAYPSRLAEDAGERMVEAAVGLLRRFPS